MIGRLLFWGGVAWLIFHDRAETASGEVPVEGSYLFRNPEGVIMRQAALLENDPGHCIGVVEYPEGVCVAFRWNQIATLEEFLEAMVEEFSVPGRMDELFLAAEEGDDPDTIRVVDCGADVVDIAADMSPLTVIEAV